MFVNYLLQLYLKLASLQAWMFYIVSEPNMESQVLKDGGIYGRR